MPTYQFTCDDCNLEGREDEYWEVTRAVSEADTELLCPECNAPMRRIYTLLGIEFKGRGFTRRGIK